MPAIINTNQIYRVGECPLFVAFVTKTDGTPLTQNNIESISVSHLQRRDGIRNGIIITDWFPVASSTDVFENIIIDNTNILDDAVDVNTNPDVRIHTQNWNTALQEYNFLYIPFDGHRYYPNEGLYRTIFRITLTNGKTDIITFDSTAGTVYQSGNDIYDILQVESEPVDFGTNIVFSGELYAKYREPHLLPDETSNPNHGNVVFPNTQQRFVDLYGGNVIDDVLLSVFDVATAQKLIDKEHLENDCLTVNPTTYGLDYTFPTTRLSVGGWYRFRFEVTAKREIIGTDTNDILCVFDIDVNVR